ncbi:MAG: hypothetical protein Q9208_007095 [Pyrenodesmia sp. 3 TL-2023]
MVPIPFFRSMFALTCLLMVTIVYASSFNTALQPSLVGVPGGPSPRPLKTCVTLKSWSIDRIEASDCGAALEMFRRAEAAKPGSQRFELYGAGAKPGALGLLTLDTPRKYTWNTCTITLGMLAGVPRGYLPPGLQFKQHFAPNDVATLDELRQAAREVIEDCVKWVPHKPLAGWQPMGELSKDIGVFVWKTGSFMDHLVRVQEDLAFDGFENRTSTA